jgi:hypothetical protein
MGSIEPGKVCAARARSFQPRIARGVRFGFPIGRESCHDRDTPMSFAHFLRIEREEPGGSRHYVVHVSDPKFSLELTPDGAAPDHIGQGVIKRICLPNSCAGDYHKYIKLLDAAQEFFAQSFGEPVAKNEMRRFNT